MAIKNTDDGIPEDLTVDIDIKSLIVDMALDLKLLIALVLAAVALFYIPYINETPIRSAIGLIIALFAPGYSLIAALFPRKAEIDGIERVALSLVMSIAITALLGLGLNYTSWGIRLDPIVVCLTVLTITFSLIANQRRHNLPPEDRFHVDFDRAFAGVKEAFPMPENRIDKALTAVLIISIILSVFVLGYVIMMPKTGEKFTELYILDNAGKADNYPTMLVLGDPQPIIVGVANHEYRDVTYDLIVILNDSSRCTELYSDHLTIANNQTWEKTIELKPDHPGDKQKIEFVLYADGNKDSPYREVNLWVDVI